MPQDQSPLQQTSEPNNPDGSLIADPEPRHLISAVEPAGAVAPRAAQRHQFELSLWLRPAWWKHSPANPPPQQC